MNNSITDFADTPAIFPGGWVTLIYNGDGGTGQARYQPAPFSASDDVIALEPISGQAAEPSLLLIASMLTHQCAPKFGFGYKLTLQRLARQKIMLPVKPEAEGIVGVDWDGLNRLGESLLGEVRKRVSAAMVSTAGDSEELPDLYFEAMPITSVFKTMKASSSWHDKVSLKSGVGRNLYLSQTRLSNGVSDVVPDQGVAAEPGNCITMTLKTQATFYQPASFYTAQNFLIFRHPSLDPDSGMMLVTALRRATAKFSWGYGVSMARLSKLKIMVPVKVKDDGAISIDWVGMSAYGRALRVRNERIMGAGA